VQLVREVADALLHLLVAAEEDVVSQHGRHRDEQTEGVMIKASPTGPATLSMDACPATPMAINAL